MKATPKSASSHRRTIAEQIQGCIREIRGSNSYLEHTPISANAHKSRDLITVQASGGTSFGLTTAEAEVYLQYLQAGHTGDPWIARTHPTPPTRSYRVTGLIESRGAVVVEASSETAARLAAYRVPRERWTTLSWLSPDAERPSFPIDLWGVENLEEPPPVTAADVAAVTAPEPDEVPSAFVIAADDPDVLWLTSRGFVRCAGTSAIQFSRDDITVTRYWSRRDGGAFRWIASAPFEGATLPHTADDSTPVGAVDGLRQLAYRIAADATARAQTAFRIIRGAA